MRTIRIKLYKFNELSDQAKQQAIEDYRNQDNYDGNYSEIGDSVKAVIELFNLKTGRQWDDIRTGHIEDSILELKGVRLYKYLINNYYNELFTPKYIGSKDRKITGKQFIFEVRKDYKGNDYTQIYSRLFKDNCCPLTGVCYDNSLLDPVYSFLSRPGKNITFEDLIRDIENAITKCYRDEEEWINSDEYITENIEANEYEFTKDGKLA